MLIHTRSLLIAGRIVLAAGVGLTDRPMHAQSAVPPAPAVPATVEACKACHGQQGVSRNPTFPNLADDIHSFAQYWSSLPATPAPDLPGAAPAGPGAQTGGDG
jgi:hypothetical protein